MSPPRASPQRSPAALALFLPLLLAACHKAPRAAAPPGITASVTLEKAADCDSLLTSVQDTANQQMRAQLEQDKAYYNCCGEYPVGVAGGATNGASGGAPASYSTTNLQVTGVDEADFMKNDGTRIFTLQGQTLYASTSWPADALSLTGKLDIEGYPSEMFLDDNRVVVFSSIWTTPEGGSYGPSGGYGPYAGGGVELSCALDADGCFWGFSTTKITVIDVSHLAAPVVTAQLYLPGYANGARRVGSSVRLVLSDNVRWPAAMQWWPQQLSATEMSQDDWDNEIDALEDSNEAVIRATTLDDWFPEGSRTLADGTTIDIGYQCSDFYLANASEQLGLSTIATIDLDDLDAGVSRASIVGDSGVLYATADHLYLASQHWWWWPGVGQRDWTYIHAFDISDPQQTAYIGSGGIDGHIQDQFAMDEQNGYLRVASSTAVWSQDPGAVDGYVVGSRLSVLAPEKVTDSSGAQGTQLKLVGEIASLEDDEQLTGMRFVGDKGYAVTFRAIDPLVTLDLSDPLNPKKVAELTVPGFSTYLQPIDDNHLLAIGEDFPVDSNGVPDYSQSSMQLSLFDVTDLAHPQRTALALVGTAAATSEALWDHHAFNWYQPDPTKPGILAIPFADWTNTSGDDPWDGFISDVRLFTADPAGTITPLGALGMSDLYISESYDDWSWWYRPWIRRSVLSTDANGDTFVYAISDAGLRSAALNQLGTPLATTLYPDASASRSVPKKR